MKTNNLQRQPEERPGVARARPTQAEVWARLDRVVAIGLGGAPADQADQFVRVDGRGAPRGAAGPSAAFVPAKWHPAAAPGPRPTGPSAHRHRAGVSVVETLLHRLLCRYEAVEKMQEAIHQALETTRPMLRALRKYATEQHVAMLVDATMACVKLRQIGLAEQREEQQLEVSLLVLAMQAEHLLHVSQQQEASLGAAEAAHLGDDGQADILAQQNAVQQGLLAGLVASVEHEHRARGQLMALAQVAASVGASDANFAMPAPAQSPVDPTESGDARAILAAIARQRQLALEVLRFVAEMSAFTAAKSILEWDEVDIETAAHLTAWLERKDGVAVRSAECSAAKS